jgi:glycosyltransferase involved in cell wall biosynthesis
MIFFCGAMDYEPNIDAAIWFTQNIFPKILQKDPTVKLEIVGRQPGPEILELASQSVSVHANVPSMAAYYERAGVVIVPIRVAGGTRIKILEAAACRCPVVSTTIGAEGLAVENEKHCLLADDEQAFADDCLRVLNDPKLAQRLGEEIYSLVKNTYDVEVVQKSIRELVA